MAKKYSTGILTASKPLNINYDFGIAAPFDTRDIVEKKEDIYSVTTWNGLAYNGMVVATLDTHELYMYIGEASSGVITETNWKQIDAGGIDWATVGDAFNSTAGHTVSDLTTSTSNASSNYISVDALGGTAVSGATTSKLFGNDNLHIDSKYLPSYVDDIIDVTVTKNDDGSVNTIVYTSNSDDGTITAGTTVKGSTGKIYVDTDGNQYRYSGSTFVQITTKTDATNIANLQTQLLWKAIAIATTE